MRMRLEARRSGAGTSQLELERAQCRDQRVMSQTCSARNPHAYCLGAHGHAPWLGDLESEGALESFGLRLNCKIYRNIDLCASFFLGTNDTP